ncbi:MAG: hypothetical protein FWD46_02800 [Cystobacterineae bacterium]|nr:hypothetical protein [Cystobacterineae bacterium]
MTDYIEQHRISHNSSIDYEVGSSNYLDELRLVLHEIKPKTVLDFGCGKAVLTKELAAEFPLIAFYAYDPAIPGRDILYLDRADLVICTNVLAHIPEDYLEKIIQKISNISQISFFILHHTLAHLSLPNGENAHCTVRSAHWYYNFFSKYFKYVQPLKGRKEAFSAIVTFPVSTDFLSTYNKITANNLHEQISSLEDNLLNLEKHTEFRLNTEQRLIETERRLTETEASRSNLEHRLAEADAQLLSVYRSRSWRITRPLRGIAGMLRGGYGLFKQGVKALLKPPLLLLIRLARRHRTINALALSCLRRTPNLKKRLQMLEMKGHVIATHSVVPPASNITRSFSQRNRHFGHRWAELTDMLDTKDRR